jgi:hypothetical protein
MATALCFASTIRTYTDMVSYVLTHALKGGKRFVIMHVANKTKRKERKQQILSFRVTDTMLRKLSGISAGRTRPSTGQTARRIVEEFLTGRLVLNGAGKKEAPESDAGRGTECSKTCGTGNGVADDKLCSFLIDSTREEIVLVKPALGVSQESAGH